MVRPTRLRLHLVPRLTARLADRGTMEIVEFGKVTPDDRSIVEE